MHAGGRSFSGSNWVDFGTGSEFEPSGSTITIGAWFRWDTGGAAGYNAGIVSKAHSTSAPFYTWHFGQATDTHRAFSFLFSRGSSYTQVVGSAISSSYDGEWLLGRCVRNGADNELTIYDSSGTQIQTNSNTWDTTAFSYGSLPLAIGSDRRLTSYWNGDVGPAWVWSDAVSAADFLHHCLRRRRRVSNLIFAWEEPLERETLDRANGTTGTVTGGALGALRGPPVRGFTRRQGSGIFVPSAAAADVTGTFSGTLPLLTMASAGEAKTAGVFAGSLPLATMSASGHAARNGPFAGSLPAMTMSGAGSAAKNGPLAGTLPLMTMSASGIVTAVHGPLAASLPLQIMSAAGEAKTAGSLAADLPLPAMAASGSAAHVGSVAADLPVLTMSGAGSAAHVGSMAADLPLPTMSSSGSVGSDVTGTMAAELPSATMSASGAVKAVHGAMAPSLPGPQMAGVGVVAPAVPSTGVYDHATAVTSGAGSSLVISVPDHIDGQDMVMVVVIDSNTDTINTPSGWTLVDALANPSAIAMSVFKRVASSEPASYTVDGWSGENAAGMIIACSATDDVDASNDSITDAADPSSPAVTPAQSGALVLVILGSDNTPHNSPSYPAGTTGIDEIESTDASANVALAAAYFVHPDTSSTGARQWDAAADDHIAYTIALHGVSVDVHGPLHGHLPAPSMAASGGVTAVHGALAATLPVLELAASGGAGPSGAFAADLPVLTMSAAGNVSTVGLVSGTLGATLPILTMASDGTVSPPPTITYPITVAAVTDPRWTSVAVTDPRWISEAIE